MDEQEALAVLGLRPPADAAAVKQAYRRLARELHPDAGGEAEAFHRVRRAYETIGDGADGGPTPRPQARTASVEDRWWDAGSAWHEDHVDRTGIELDRSVPDEAAVAVDPDLLASVLAGGEPVAPVQLHSRSPGSRLHRVIAWLQPDLLARVTIAPAVDGPRPGHDVAATIQSAGGRGRRVLAADAPPDGWTRARGSETVRIERRLRPCRQPADTAVRITRELERALAHVGWPLGDWFILRV